MIGLFQRRRPALLIAGLLLFSGVALPAEERRTVLLVEHPDRFVLFNKYQQRLTTNEYQSLPAILPMVVIRESDRLGDGLTPCAAVEIDGTMFYLQKDQSGAFIRRGGGGSITFMRGALVLGDTVALIQGRALHMKAAGDGRDVTLASGSRAARLFEVDGRTFVRLLRSGTHAGWLVLPPAARSVEWKPVESSQVQNESAERVEHKLSPVVADANRALHSVYRQLAAEAGENRTPPSFRLLEDDGEIRCAIEPVSLSNAFAGSLRELLPEFERALLGTGLRPSLEGGVIVVPLR